MHALFLLFVSLDFLCYGPNVFTSPCLCLVVNSLLQFITVPSSFSVFLVLFRFNYFCNLELKYYRVHWLFWLCWEFLFFFSSLALHWIVFCVLSSDCSESKDYYNCIKEISKTNLNQWLGLKKVCTKCFQWNIVFACLGTHGHAR